MIASFLRRLVSPTPQPEIIVVAATERFYRVVMKDKSVRFVDTSHPTKVKLHIADTLIESVEPATQRECVEAVKAGIVMERPGEVAPTPQGSLLP